MLKYPDRDKQGKRKQPDDPRLMQLAQKENFAIFLLKGRSTNAISEVVPSFMVNELERVQKRMINYIKNTQQQRMGKRKVKP